MICGVPDEGPLCVVMLMLSGRATPHLHNGILYVGDEEHYVSNRILRTWKKKKKKKNKFYSFAIHKCDNY